MQCHRNPAEHWAIALAALLLYAAGGCGYHIRPPFDPNIKTVYVPVFRSFTYRRDLNLQLTELVQKKIKERTTYKVVGSPDQADATLEGVIKFLDKNATVESPNNLPRQITGNIQVEVRFIPTHRLDDQKVYPPNLISEIVTFYPELGETAELGYFKAMDKIADQIVSAMENPW